MVNNNQGDGEHLSDFRRAEEQAYVYSGNNSNFTNFLHSDWLFGRLYTSIKAMHKNTQFSPLKWRDVTG